MSDIILMNGRCRIRRELQPYEVTVISVWYQMVEGSPFSRCGEWIIPFMTPQEEAKVIKYAINKAVRAITASDRRREKTLG